MLREWQTDMFGYQACLYIGRISIIYLNTNEVGTSATVPKMQYTSRT